MMLKWALSFSCSDGSSVACCEATAGGLCVESPAVHWDAVPLHACPSSLSSCPSSPSLCSCVCLFALPNYPLGTIKIDWTGLCGLRMNDRLSVAGVMRSHCRRTCRPSQLSICLPVLLSESVKLSASPPLLHRLGVALLVSLSPPLMSSCLSVCPQLLSLLLSPLVCPYGQVLFIFNSQTPGFFTAEREKFEFVGLFLSLAIWGSRKWLIGSQNIYSWMGILENSFPAYHRLIADLRLGGLENYISHWQLCQLEVFVNEKKWCFHAPWCTSCHYNVSNAL